MYIVPEAAPLQMSSQIAAKLAEMQPRFRISIRQRLDALETLREGPQLDRDPRTTLETIRAVAHKTVGLAAPMGYHELGALCSTAESSIDDLLASLTPDQTAFAATLSAIDDMLGEMALIVDSDD